MAESPESDAPEAAVHNAPVAVRTPFSVAHGPHQLHGSTWSRMAVAVPRVLSLHGGGAGTNHRRVDYLLQPLATQGWAGAAFDFVGHGITGGSLLGSSLADRQTQALAVAAHLGLGPACQPLALIASSMGGHTACQLLDTLQPRALVLFCPAAYTPAAEHQPFGPAFQQTLRATTNFADALAWAALRHFRGRLLLVWGAEDAVIPPTVIQGYGQAAKAARSLDVVQLPGVGHALHAWLQTQPGAALALQHRIAALLAAAERD
jgi:pimeloyl-ACP methyl ester carboxylesterase